MVFNPSSAVNFGNPQQGSVSSNAKFDPSKFVTTEKPAENKPDAQKKQWSMFDNLVD